MGASEGTATASVLKGAKVLMRMDVEVIVAMFSQHKLRPRGLLPSHTEFDLVPLSRSEGRKLCGSLLGNLYLNGLFGALTMVPSNKPEKKRNFHHQLRPRETCLWTLPAVFK